MRVVKSWLYAAYGVLAARSLLALQRDQSTAIDWRNQPSADVAVLLSVDGELSASVRSAIQALVEEKRAPSQSGRTRRGKLPRSNEF